MEKIIKKEEWERYHLFKQYDEETNPFINITVPIDITDIYHYSKNNNVSFYATFGYVITKAVNQVDSFKYRKVDDDIIFYDEVKSNYVEMISEDLINYFTIPFNKNFNEYVVNFNKTRTKLKQDNILSDNVNHDEIWMSCVPWFNFTSLITPFDKAVSIPQFVWDRFKFNNEKVEVNLMIMVHHGFIDGFQINKFIKILENEINNFKGDE